MKRYFQPILFIYLIFSIGWCFAADRVAITVIYSSDAKAYKQAWQGFREFLSQSVVLVISEHNLEKKDPAEVHSLIYSETPDIVLAIGVAASKFAKDRIKKTPVVLCMVFDPQEYLEQNITGVSLKIPTKWRLEKIRRILPKAKKNGLIYSASSVLAYKEISKVCAQMGFQIIGRRVDSEKAFAHAFDDIKLQVDCFVMIPDPAIYFQKSIEHLLREGLKAKLPIIGLSSSYTKAGALASFDCDYIDLGKQAGEIASKILNGKNPMQITPAPPRKRMISLNLSVAERIGIEITPEVIKEAGEVFGK